MDNLSNPLNLLATNMCSPMIIFVVYIIVSAVSMYMTHNSLKKYNTEKMDILFNVHLYHEIKLLVVLGFVIYGLCQYNQVTLAWVFLIFPVIYVLLKNVLVYVPVSTAKQNIPVQKRYTPSKNMFSQVEQQENDRTRVLEMQKNFAGPFQEPKEKEKGDSIGTPVGKLNIMGGVSSNLMPPLNSNTGGFDPSGNMAGF